MNIATLLRQSARLLPRPPRDHLAGRDSRLRRVRSPIRRLRPLLDRAKDMITDDELTAHCRATLAGYKIPRRYFRVESIPRNAYGKVLKRELRRMADDGQL
jgi:acyl-CoA synthetase (AMP-forming)/AMP-acid ligase II